jgi:hypothetical protein
VDDILILADKVEAKRLIDVFQKDFRWIMHSTSCEQSYLGMIVRMQEGKAMSNMMYYVKKLFEAQNNLQPKANLGGKNAFVINGGAQQLSEEKRCWFHTQVTCLLYLSKHARPDVMTVTIFLCTQVQHATEENWKKLERVLGYLLAMKKQCMVLYTGGSYASFALHGNSKLHTGVQSPVNRNV